MRALGDDLALSGSLRPKALFVSDKGHLGPGKGGVQRCTQEFLEVLRRCGLEIHTIPICSKNGLWERLKGRVVSDPYDLALNREALESIRDASQLAEVVFVNQMNLTPAVTRAISGLGRQPRVFALSHGAEITDMLHLARLKGSLPLSGRLRPTKAVALGRTLLAEVDARRRLDGVIAISPSDVEFERWLGCRNVTWVPRAISRKPLESLSCTPVHGFVGTLDHAPNLEGLLAVLDNLRLRRSGPQVDADKLQVEVIGGPTRLGEHIAARYPFV